MILPDPMEVAETFMRHTEKLETNQEETVLFSVSPLLSLMTKQRYVFRRDHGEQGYYLTALDPRTGDVTSDPKQIADLIRLALPLSPEGGYEPRTVEAKFLDQDKSVHWRVERNGHLTVGGSKRNVPLEHIVLNDQEALVCYLQTNALFTGITERCIASSKPPHRYPLTLNYADKTSYTVKLSYDPTTQTVRVPSNRSWEEVYRIAVQHSYKTGTVLVRLDLAGEVYRWELTEGVFKAIDAEDGGWDIEPDLDTVRSAFEAIQRAGSQGEGEQPVASTYAQVPNSPFLDALERGSKEFMMFLELSDDDAITARAFKSREKWMIDNPDFLAAVDEISNDEQPHDLYVGYRDKVVQYSLAGGELTVVDEQTSV